MPRLVLHRNAYPRASHGENGSAQFMPAPGLSRFHAPLAQLQARADRSPLVRGLQTKQERMSRTSLGNALTVQRYQVRKAPEDGRIYSQSDNGVLATGMGTPNHELYSTSYDSVNVINKNIKASPLEVYVLGNKALFGQEMFSLGLRYKSKRLVDEGRKEKIRRKEIKGDFIESSKKGNLQKQYETRVLPYIQLFRETVVGRALDEIEEMGLEKSEAKVVRNYLYEVVQAVNLFKKVVNAELANTGKFDKGTARLSEVYLRLIETVEDPLYRVDLTRDDLKAAKQQLLELWFDDIDRENPNLVNQVSLRILDELNHLIRVFPKDRALNMMPFHRTNFNVELISHLYSTDNLALYRACDVQASTLLGNKLTPENVHRLKIYSAGVDTHFHYATKIVETGNDWVTLEHFALSEREREVSGLEGAAAKNLDHTWQYIMQGSTPSTKDTISDQDQYFEHYTKIRYYLKGLRAHQSGVFDPERRQRAYGPNDKSNFNLSGMSHLSNVIGWKAFQDRVSNPEEENKLRNEMNHMDLYNYPGMDPLVHSKLTWDHIMGL